MIPPATTEVIPLATDADGVVRVGGTRVTLDAVIEAFQDGAAPEEIAQQYPTVSLADIYSVIGYYLRRTDEVDAYMQQRRALGESVRAESMRRFDPEGVRARLLARRSPQG